MSSVSNGSNYPIASLYVGDLNPDITEAQLYERFSNAGPIISIRVCRDQVTKQSLGYAYVNFQQPADAERALDTMNFDLLCGRPMRIMWSQRDPALRKSGVGNIFIKNLDKSIDNKALYDTFSAFGNILSCKIMTDEHGNSRSYGFVHFETNEAAVKAIENVNNMLLNGKKVYVGRFISQIERTTSVDKKFTNIFVKNFGDTLNDERLKELFQKYGEITSATVARDENGGIKGYGFVNFKNPISAEKAVNELNGLELNGRKVFVGKFMKKYERQNEFKRKNEEKRQKRIENNQGINLYVKNLDENVDDEKLREEFAAFGTITSAKVMKDGDRSRGFGFVCYTSSNEATKALTEMNGRIIGTKPLYVTLAQRKDERKAQLSNQYMQRIQTIRMQQHQSFTHGLNGLINANGTFYANATPFTQPRWLPGNTTTQQIPRNQLHQYQTFQLIQHHSLQQQQQHQQQNMNKLRYTTSRANYNNQRNQTQNFIKSNNFYRKQEINQQQYQNQHEIQQQSQNEQQQQRLNPYNQAKNPIKMQTNVEASQQNNQQNSDLSINYDKFTQASVQDQKQILGEHLYSIVCTIHPDWAGKITGMLLEIDNAELIHMLQSTDLLKAKVDEAINVLKSHQTKLATVGKVEGLVVN